MVQWYDHCDLNANVQVQLLTITYKYLVFVTYHSKGIRLSFDLTIINIRNSAVVEALVFRSWSLWFKSASLSNPVTRCHSLILLKHTNLTYKKKITKFWFSFVLFYSPRWGTGLGRRLPLTLRLAAPLLASPSAPCCSGLLSCPSARSAMLLLLGLNLLLSCLLTIHHYHFSTWPVWPPIPFRT